MNKYLSISTNLNQSQLISFMDYLFTKTPLSFLVRNLWRDEAFSYVMSVQNLKGIIEKSAADFSPPLYYLLLHYWVKIFGSSEIALRSLSFLFFVLTIYIVYDILTIVFKIPIKRAVIYCLLVLVNPVLNFYAFEARMYMMGAFFVALSYFSLWTKRKNLYILSIALAFYTHYFTILIFVGQILKIFLDIVRDYANRLKVRNNQSRSISINLNKSQLISILLPVLLFFPWLLYLLYRHDFVDSNFWVTQPYLSDIRFLFFTLYTGYEKVFGQYYHSGPGFTEFHSNLNILLILTVTLPIIFHFVNKHKFINKNIFLEIVLWAFGPPIILFVFSYIEKPFYHPRYFMFSTLGFLLLTILCVELVFQNLNLYKVLEFRKTLRFESVFTALFASLIALLFYFTGNYNKLNLKYHSKRNVRTMYEEIALSAKPGDVIYITNELDYHLALYYTKFHEIYIYGKTYAEIPSYVGKALIPKSSLKSTYPYYPARAFIIHYNSYETRSQL